MAATPTTQSTVQVLLVEDDEIDAEAIRRAMKKRQLPNPITTVHDGQAGLDALRRDQPPRPNLVLLDINMPGMNGHEFLEELRKDPAIRDTLVFVLTTSNAQRDKVLAYEKNVAGYIVKSSFQSDFTDLMGLLEPYWNTVEFPPKRPMGP